LTGASIFRELGVLLTDYPRRPIGQALYRADRNDAGQRRDRRVLTIGLDPVEVLVLPGCSRCLVTLPMLTCAPIHGSSRRLDGVDRTRHRYSGVPQSAVHDRAVSFWIGMIKSPFFAIIIALIGCYEGFQVAAAPKVWGA